MPGSVALAPAADEVMRKLLSKPVETMSYSSHFFVYGIKLIAFVPL